MAEEHLDHGACGEPEVCECDSRIPPTSDPDATRNSRRAWGQLSHAPVVCRDGTGRSHRVRGAAFEILTLPYSQPYGVRGFSGEVARSRSQKGARGSGG